MQKKKPIFIIVISLIMAMTFATGCSNDAFYPASDLQISSVDPYHIIPTGLTLSEIPDGIITVENLNTIPCRIISYDFEYATRNNEPINSIALYNNPADIPIDGEGNANITVKPYSLQLVNLFENTPSDISPVRATVILHFEDVNKNHITKKASFLLYKFNDTSEE